MALSTTRFCMFSGLVHVRIPASWVTDEAKVRWYAKDGVQYVDFTANGGSAFAFSEGFSKPGPGVWQHWQTSVVSHCREIDPSTIQGWGDLKTSGFYVSSLLFGASDDIIDLVPPQPLPAGEPLVFPPEIIQGIEVDVTVPFKYLLVEDGMGGGGYQVVIARTEDGRLLVRYAHESYWTVDSSYDYALTSYKDATTMRPWEWMTLDEVSLEEFVAAYVRRGYNGGKKLPAHVCQHYTPDGMILWDGFIKDGKTVEITVKRHLPKLEQLQRQVGGHRYHPFFDKTGLAHVVPQDRFIDSWDDVHVVTIKFKKNGKLSVSSKKVGELVSLGNQYEKLPVLNRRRLAKLQAK